MVTPAPSRLTTVAARITRQFPAVQYFATRRLRIEPSVPPEKVGRNRDNPDGQNHLCAAPPNVFHPSDTVLCFALGGAT